LIPLLLSVIVVVVVVIVVIVVIVIVALAVLRVVVDTPTSRSCSNCVDPTRDIAVSVVGVSRRRLESRAEEV